MNNLKFNPALLLTARRYRDISQTALAKNTGLTQGYYSKIENDLLVDGPSPEAANKIAEALNFPISFFYQVYPIAGEPSSIHPMYRKSSGIGEKAINKLTAELNIRIIQLKKLLHAVDIENEIPLPDLRIEDVGSPAKVAQALRKAWMLPQGPITNLTELVEQAGCLVILCDFDIPVDGVTIRFQGIPPCIFLNASAPPDRRRFSLAHELGHIIMHKIPVGDDIEEEANSFASEFLMPEKDIKRYLTGKMTLDKLVRLKSIWRVSMQAILFKASAIDAISANQNNYLWRMFSKRGWKIREPEETDFEYEEPSIFPEILRLHVQDLMYTNEEIESLLHTYVSDLYELYGNGILNQPRLRLHIVK